MVGTARHERERGGGVDHVYVVNARSPGVDAY